MQQKIQFVVGCPKSGKKTVVGEFSDVETESLPVSHITDPAEKHDDIRPHAGDIGIGRDPDGQEDHDGKSCSAAARSMIFLIRIYQKCISPWLPCECRFEPSCSHYAVDAFRKRGFLAGFVLTVWRLMRCQPFGAPGYDPVPEKGFRRKTNETVTDEK